jgi:hypothetical protein
MRLVASERQPPHAGEHESLLYVELRRTVLESPMLSVLRFLERSDVRAVPGSAGGEMIHRIRQRLAIGVCGQQRESLGESPFQLGLE